MGLEIVGQNLQDKETAEKHMVPIEFTLSMTLQRKGNIIIHSLYVCRNVRIVCMG